jgi:hypothetical protein
VTLVNFAYTVGARHAVPLQPRQQQNGKSFIEIRGNQKDKL